MESLIGLFGAFVVLAMLIWGFVMYVKSLMHAAKTEKWGWFVMMLLMWPLFFVYLWSKYEPPDS
jgi:Na+-driven multidrug efflux pump